MKTSRFLLALPMLVAACLPLSALADHDDDDDEGGYHGKQEFWVGNCKIKREWEDGKYKEERECKDRYPAAVYVQPAPVVVAPPPAVVYPPWVVYQQGQPVYRSGQEPVPMAGSRGDVAMCNSESVGRVLGGITGAVVGNQFGGGNGRAVATIGGAIAGVLIGGQIGRDIDARDQACIGQALEFAPVGQRIEWPSSSARQYAVVPGRVTRRGNEYCRRYDAEVRTASGRQKTSGVACRRPDGVWVAAR